MDAFRSIRTIRLLLATCVSFWLAGAGCLFGCSYGPGAVVEARTAATSAVSGPSCHAMRSHDCCTKKQQPKADKDAIQLHKLMLNDLPSGMMSDCPLAVNQTAAISPVKSEAPAFVLAHSAMPPVDLSQVDLKKAAAPLSIPNKGPTHVLHCVFLI